MSANALMTVRALHSKFSPPLHGHKFGENLKMSTTGLSKPRLGRLHTVLSGYIDRKDMPGLVALVSRHDDTHIETLGSLVFGSPSPMRSDTIFRIASLTKLVTAVATMILIEDCKFRLDDSIEPWLP